MKKVKKIFDIVQWILVAIVILVGVVLVLSRYDTPLKFRLLSVQSGSMEPKIKVGSLVVVRSKDNYEKDDIITFRSERNRKESVTHRIVEVFEDKETGAFSYETKGDANESVDGERILKKRVIGKVNFTIPYLGYPISFVQTQTGFLVLIIVPGTILIYTELVNIKNEVIKIIKNRKKKVKKVEVEKKVEKPKKSKKKKKKEKNEKKKD